MMQYMVQMLDQELFTFAGGKLVVLNEKPDNREGKNFLIVCPYGDYTGFKSLQACIDQLMRIGPERPDNFFAIVRR